jgi:hydrogenase maturation protease
VSLRILVAGIGNVLMSDDGIGPCCTRHLMAGFEFPPNVEVADLGTPGLDLALHFAEADIVLLIDALRGIVPGTIERYDDSAVSAGRSGTRLETHSPALQESILIARLAGNRPRDVRLVGLSGANFDHGTALTAAIRLQIPSLIDAVLDELTRLGVRWSRRSEVATPDLWWEQPVEQEPHHG